jgi:hypothetical protein
MMSHDKKKKLYKNAYGVLSKRRLVLTILHWYSTIFNDHTLVCLFRVVEAFLFLSHCYYITFSDSLRSISPSRRLINFALFPQG